MQVSLEATAGDGSPATASLFRWLMRDGEIRRQVDLSITAESAPGMMGGFDVINAVLTQVISLASLLVSIAAWRDSRSENDSVRVTVGNRSIAIDGDPSEVASVISALLNSPDEREDSVVGNPPRAQAFQ